jgi:hypothetical protein
MYKLFYIKSDQNKKTFTIFLFFNIYGYFIMIIHICGASGSGKSYLGKKLQIALKNKVIVIDMDNLLELFMNKYKFTTSRKFGSDYQKFIDEFIIKTTKQCKNIIFVGLNAFVLGETHCWTNKLGNDECIELPKLYFDLQSDYNFFIDVTEKIIIEQMYY